MSEEAIQADDMHETEVDVLSSMAATPRWATRWQLPVFLVALVAWGVFVGLSRRREVKKVEDPRAAAFRIIRACEKGQYEKVLQFGTLFCEVYPDHEKAPEVAYYTGIAAYRLGEALPQEADARFEEAVGHLERALAGGLDEAMTFEARHTLAICQGNLGRDRAALNVLVALAEAFPAKAENLVLERARIEFRLRDVGAGEASIERILGRSGLTDVERVDALLERAQGYLTNGRLDAAEEDYRRVLKEFPEDHSKEAHFGLGMTLRRKSAKDPALLEEARRTFESVLASPIIIEDLDRKAGFFAADCLYAKQDYKNAELAFRKVVLLYGGTREGMAAGLRLAAVLVNRGRYGAAREALSRVLRQVPEDGRLTSEYVTPAEVNSIWREVLRHYLSEGDYEKLEKMNQQTSKVAGQDVYLYQQASLYRHRGRELLADAAKLRELARFSEAAVKEKAARADLQRAGRLFVRIVNAAQAKDAVYDRALQQAPDALADGGEHAAAVVYYRLLIDASDERDADVYVRYGVALQALGRHAEAIAEFEKCMTKYGRVSKSEGAPPVVYDAMLARARSYVALREWERAEKALGEILYPGDVLQPKARLWQRALSEMAYVLYCRGKYKDAVGKLDEVLTRKGVLSVSRFGRAEVSYYLADAYRNIRSDEPAARKSELAAAARHFRDVRDAVKEGAAVTPLLERMVRRSTVAEADCRYELGTYAEALKVYEFAAEKYLDSIEGVGALYGVAASLHHLGENDRAAVAAERARWSLDKLKQSGPVPKFLEDAWNALVVWSVAATET